MKTMKDLMKQIGIDRPKLARRCIKQLKVKVDGDDEGLY